MSSNFPQNAAQLAALLEATAKRGDVIHYSDIVRQFGLPPLDGAWGAHPLSKLFEYIDQQDSTANRPFRTSVVVAKESGGPGSGFFEALERLKGIQDPRTPVAREAIWLREIQACYQYPWP